jgi:chemotaxis protein methyltransferase CheR
MISPIGGEISISDEEFMAFQQLIKSLSGIYLADSKKQLVFGRLRNRVRQVGLTSFEAYLKVVKNPLQIAERQMMVDLLTTNETYFFREPKHFDFLKAEVLPHREKGRTLRIWSAACSSGEEPYSIGMVLADLIGIHKPSAWEITASDISQRIVDKAKLGVYANQRLDGIPPHYLKKYFTKVQIQGEDKIEIIDSIKERIRYQRLNLNENLPELGKFDVIFLRNMLIYFQKEIKIEIAQRVIKTLQPGGWLMIGHSESLKDVDPKLKTVAPSIYRLASI